MIFGSLFAFVFSGEYFSLGGFIGDGRKAMIQGTVRNISDTCLWNLKSFPFLRFMCVFLTYDGGPQSIAKKCELFKGYLHAIKSALSDSNLIRFTVTIGQQIQYFSSHIKLIEHLRNELLPICESSRHYQFVICDDMDTNTGAEIITSILEAPQIVCCPNVEIGIYKKNKTATQLSVEVIDKWLNHTVDKKKEQHKFLHIFLSNIQNLLEICGHLTEVIYILISHVLKFKGAHYFSVFLRCSTFWLKKL